MLGSKTVMCYSHKPGGCLGSAGWGFCSTRHLWQRAPGSRLPPEAWLEQRGPRWPGLLRASLHTTASRPSGLAQASWKQLASRKENTEVVSLPFKAWCWKPQNVTVATSYRRKPSLEASFDSRGRELHSASSREAWPGIYSHP